MGTRGLIGLRYKGKDKFTYNHYDSYPSELGVAFLESVKKFNIGQMRKAFINIKLIKNEDKKPTQKEIKKYFKYGDPSVGDDSIANKKINSYYQLLHGLQGNIEPYLSAEADIMINSNDFIKDSLFCEWAYIINLDTGKLEVWKGFNKENTDNRYKLTEDEMQKDIDWWKENRGIVHKFEYFSCKMVKEFDLNNLPSKEQFLKLEND